MFLLDKANIVAEATILTGQALLETLARWWSPIPIDELTRLASHRSMFLVEVVGNGKGGAYDQ